jgi:hypothetical protein
MSDNPKPWRTYEEVAQYLLNEFAAHFGLGHVEGKQVVPGQSGADWEIDAKGVAVNGEVRDRRMPPPYNVQACPRKCG